MRRNRRIVVEGSGVGGSKRVLTVSLYSVQGGNSISTCSSSVQARRVDMSLSGWIHFCFVCFY